MVKELVERGMRGVGVYQMEEFHFVELVQAQQATSLARSRTHLASKSGRPCNIAQRKRTLWYDRIAMQTYQRHFGRRIEVQFIFSTYIHLVLELRQLPGSLHD